MGENRRTHVALLLIGVALLAGLAWFALRGAAPGPRSSVDDNRSERAPGAPATDGRAEPGVEPVPTEAVPERPPTILRGTVVDEAGRPFPGAEVRILLRTSVRTGNDVTGPHADQIRLAAEFLGEGRPLPGVRVATDASGEFVREGLEPGLYDLFATGAGKAAGRARGVTVRIGATTSARLALGPAATFRGSVLDAADRPGAGAVVVAIARGDLLAFPYAPAASTRAGSDGSFEIGGLREGAPYVLVARTADGCLGVLPGPTPPAKGIVLRTCALVTLVGTVRDDATGEPVPGAELVGLLGVAETDADGRYELPGLLADPILAYVQIRKVGYVDRRVALGLLDATDEPESRDFRLVPEAMGRLRAFARDASGSPLGGVAVEAVDGCRGTVRARGETSPSGDVILARLPTRFASPYPGSVWLRAVKPGWRTVQVRDGEARPDDRHWVLVKADSEKTVDLVLVPATMLTGRVLDPAGEPLPAVTVAFGTARVETDAEGRFTLPETPAGFPVTIRLRKPGFAKDSVEVLAGRGPVDLTLRPGGRIAGRVVDEADRPVAGATIRVIRTDNRNREREVESQEDGTFLVENLPATVIAIEAGREGGVTRRLAGIDLREGSSSPELLVRLPRGLAVRVVPVRPDGREATATVVVHGPLDSPPAERISRAFWHRPGEDLAPLHLLPGRYGILACPEGDDEDCGAAEVEEGIRTRGEIRVRLERRPRRIVVRPALGDGGSIRGAPLDRTEPATPAVSLVLVPGPDGILRSPPLPPGRYRLAVWYQASSEEGLTVRRVDGLEPGGDAIDLDLTTPR